MSVHRFFIFCFMTLSHELKIKAFRQLKKSFLEAEKFFNRSFFYPTLTFNARGKKAGAAYLIQNEIRLNPILFSENPEIFLTEVIPHELAHLLTFQLYGKVKPHGQEWQQIMHQVFHLQPKVTHQMNIKSVQGKTFSYRCRCQSFELSARRHNKVMKGVKYFCRLCKEALKPIF